MLIDFQENEISWLIPTHPEFGCHLNLEALRLGERGGSGQALFYEDGHTVNPATPLAAHKYYHPRAGNEP